MEQQSWQWSELGFGCCVCRAVRSLLADFGRPRTVFTSQKNSVFLIRETRKLNFELSLKVISNSSVVKERTYSCTGQYRRPCLPLCLQKLLYFKNSTLSRYKSSSSASSSSEFFQINRKVGTAFFKSSLRTFVAQSNLLLEKLLKFS